MSARNNITSFITLVSICIGLPVVVILGCVVRLHRWGLKPLADLWRAGA